MSATVGPILNGNMPVVHHLHEALEYEKILKLRDEVFAGGHPRLTVPAHAVQPPAQSLSQAHLNVLPTYPPSAPPNFVATTQSRREEDATAAARLQTQPHGSSAPSTQPASNVSEFDPVLLTKSDDLVRAEVSLKRQRLEKALRDQFEQKRLDARKKPAMAEAKPDFDLQAIVSKATDPAKDISPKDDGSASESVDENSFYSSRAPDSIQDGQSSSGGDEEGEADQPSGPRVSAVMGSPLQLEGDDRKSTNIQNLASHATETATRPVLPHTSTAMDLDDDEEEEGEYSPPEAMEQSPFQGNVNTEAMQDSRDPRGRPLRRYSELGDNGRRGVSPTETNMRIVRNHITSPLGPRPSRVSPLAVAKDQPFSQNARQSRSRRVPRPGSPPSPDDFQSVPARKKRKLEKQRKPRRNGGLSPDAFIKEENVSPPPFHDVQPLGSGRLRPVASSDRPIVINDDETIQEVRYMPPPDRYVESPSRPLPRQVEQLMPLSEPRALSRSSIRPLRDDQDLRRVASLHNMRAEGGRDYGDPHYETPTRVRAASYARLGSPALMESPRQHRDLPADYDHALQEVRVVRTPAPIYREVYDDAEPGIRYAPETMPPPPPPVERIVVDQYGRRFREIIQPERASVVPRAMSVRRGDLEPLYENYQSPRASSVFVDAGPERSYPSEMLPPQVAYRRPAEPHRSSAVPGSATREFLEPAQVARPSSVQLADRLPRQPIYADDRADFREPIRMSSVRPAAARYDEPQPVEMFGRGQSVRPAGREGSVFMDDRPRVRHEYLPAEQPRYRMVEPEKRYFDAQGREIITMDGPPDGRQRIVERY